MTMETQVRDLEAALVARAKALMQEHLDKGKAERERILSECGRRLRLKEERELLAAKADAERLYRQRVQAAEIRLQGELDRLRWTLVQSALERVWQDLAVLAGDEPRYDKVLAHWLAAGCALIPHDHVVAELNARDHQRLAGRWESFAGEAVPGRRVSLAHAPHKGSGGVVVRSEDDRMRVDNSFEGRIERLEETIQRTVLERLFAAVPDMGTLFHG